MNKGKLTMKKRMRTVAGVFTVLFIVLVGALVWRQFVQGAELKAGAEEQQTRDQKIASKRGNIYDRNMNVLATSGTAERIYINPKLISKTESDAKDRKAKAEEEARKNGTSVDTEFPNINLTEKVVNVLTTELGVSEPWLRDQLAKTDRVSVEVKANVEKSVADKVREADLVGIEFIGDTKRYYPNGPLASHLLGFTGKDGQGLEGLENILDDELSGTAGRVRSAKSAGNGDMPFQYETYEAAKDGNNVILTIDKTIQQIVENHLQTAYEENDLGNGAAAIIMNPKTGEILAMAVTPSYDPSNYSEISDPTMLAQVDEVLADHNADYNAAQRRIEIGEPEKGDEDIKEMTYDEAYAQILLKLRRNKAVVDSYEPGSTFKTIVASAALEENVVSLDDTFVCTGAKTVKDRLIHCSRREGHGTETFVEGIKNSCNPVFMDVGARLGAETFDKYFRAFGLTEKTGFLLPGETAGTHHELSAMGPVELATSSFGQTFTVTPLQMVRAVSAVVNGGYLMEPHIVKAYTDSDGNILETVDPVIVRRVISQQTSETMRDVLERVVSEGGGSAAYVKGYRIGGKTGTSQKIPREANKYIASFVGFAPADDPEIVCLVILDEPMNGLYYGGTIAAPVAGSIIADTLQYLGYDPQYSEDDADAVRVVVPDVLNKNIDEAASEIADMGLRSSIKGSGDNVIRQIPAAGTRLHSDSIVIIYTDDAADAGAVTEVPSIRTKNYQQAKALLENMGLEMDVSGGQSPDELGSDYIAVSQNPAAGSIVARGTTVYVDFAMEFSD